MGCCCYCYTGFGGYPECYPGHFYGDPPPSTLDPEECYYWPGGHGRAEAAFWLEGWDCDPLEGNNPCPPNGNEYLGNIGKFARRQCCCPYACCHCFDATGGPLPVPPLLLTLSGNFPNTSVAQTYGCDCNAYLNDSHCLSPLNGEWPLYEPFAPIGPIEKCLFPYVGLAPQVGPTLVGSMTDNWAKISHLIDQGFLYDREEWNLICERLLPPPNPTNAYNRIFFKARVQCAGRAHPAGGGAILHGYKLEASYFDIHPFDPNGDVIILDGFIPIQASWDDPFWPGFDCTKNGHWIHNGSQSAQIDAYGIIFDATLTELGPGDACGVPVVPPYE